MSVKTENLLNLIANDLGNPIVAIGKESFCITSLNESISLMDFKTGAIAGFSVKESSNNCPTFISL